MTTIRCIYFPEEDGLRRDPGFPVTDQHPQAVRYPFDHPTRGALNVDAVGDAPTLAEVDAVLNPPPSIEAQRAAALRALDDARLAAAAQDPTAPQAVKDFSEAIVTLEQSAVTLK